MFQRIGWITCNLGRHKLMSFVAFKKVYIPLVIYSSITLLPDSYLLVDIPSLFSTNSVVVPSLIPAVIASSLMHLLLLPPQW